MTSLAGTIHKSDFPYVSILSNNQIEVRLQTPKNNVDNVIVGYNDPYNYNQFQWVELEVEMELVASDDLYDWWQSTLTVDTKRFAYNFKIDTKSDGRWYLTEAGLTRDYEVLYQFNLPFSHESEIFTYPKWVDDAIWYQIFPDRFATSNDDSMWHAGTVTNDQVYGGNIQGIISKLDYLHELGINSIYFTPIFTAGSTHKYDTIDYFSIDPQFGTEQDFQNLINEAHNRGIKIMLDGVFNHTSSEHPHFQDVLKHKQNSKYADWYHIRDFEKLDLVHKTDFKQLKAYDSFAYVDRMPKLNTQNSEVIEYVFEAVTKWTEMGIDGWRLDVANEVDHNFWKLFKSHVTSINPDIYIVGEIWHDAGTWLRGDEFHSVMNYKYTNSIIDYFFKNSIDLWSFENRITRALFENITAVNKAAFNVLDSHDTMRVSNMCNFNITNQKLGTVFLLTQQGTPCIYYGTEIGLEGGTDPDNRRLMQWDKASWNVQLYDFYKQIIKVRNEHDTLRNNGRFEFIPSSICSYRRFNQSEEYIVHLNTSESDFEYVAVNPIMIENYAQNIIKPGGFVIDKRS